jgi:hypothetical protein
MLRPSEEVYVPIGCASATIAHEAELLVVFPPPVPLPSVVISGVVLVDVLPSPLPLLFTAGVGGCLLGLLLRRSCCGCSFDVFFFVVELFVCCSMVSGLPS